MTGPLVRTLEMRGESFFRLDFDHPEVEARVLDEMAAGIDVYYDRHWPFTQEFCEFLLDHPELVRGRNLLVAGAGVGMEAVVGGRLAKRLWINDWAPVALELQERQLEANGLSVVDTICGSFGELELPPEVDLVLGCFVVYDAETAGAVEAMLERNLAAGVPTLLADLDLGGHFSRLLERFSEHTHRIAFPGSASDDTSRIQVVRAG
ncbi:MAG: hypothetical protein EA351_05890 [Gemmatimonadales bacterium]|nr:MAG: hypothetical protein EA351_05890 [Gemmatimonadales bacterium]